MLKTDQTGMQTLAAKRGDYFLGAVNGISGNRMPQIGHMDPDLMSPASLKP